jgi:SIR2-like domain
MDAWFEALAERRLVPFVGAGVSMVPPSSLPGWLRFNQAVLEALAAVAQPVIGATAEQIARKCVEAQGNGRLPPEYAAEIAVERFGDGYFQVLQALEGERPNAVHRTLAALLGARLVRAIVTTSFDTLIERACAELGVPLQVLVLGEDYAPFTSPDALRWHFEDPHAPGLLLKLHGTASQPETCIDTLAQRKRGLPPAVNAAVRAVVAQAHLLMLGFSGADLEAEPNYLGLRSLAAEPSTPGFTWLHRPGSPPPPAVRTVASLYGPRAQLVEGLLPEWLAPADRLLAHLGAPVPPVPPSSGSDAERRAEAEAT